MEGNNERKKKILVVFGTRPEAVKMCPLVKVLETRDAFQTIVCVTGQHKEMLEQVLGAFHITPDFDLHIMKKKQDLYDVTVNVMVRLKVILEQVKPDLVLVHGDTSTTFSAALACFYSRIPVGHVEAGLRTGNMYSPYPEEFNRQAASLITALHFAPTHAAKENLVREGKEESRIFITGNTAIDALNTTIRTGYTHPILDWAEGGRLIIITAHRRENLGKPMEHMFRAIKRVLEEYHDIKAVYPIHMNPLIRQTADSIFEGCDRIKLVEPLDVLDFHNILSRCYLILTDSGGIQEEAPALGKPVLVMRDTTERPEGVLAGTLKLVGTKEDTIYNNFKMLLEDKKSYYSMSQAVNPYGDGTACTQIADILERELCQPGD